jgi:altronate dehydratase small subunit
VTFLGITISIKASELRYNGSIIEHPKRSLKDRVAVVSEVTGLAGKRRYVIVDDRDNVATVVEMLKKGEVIEVGTKNITLLRDIPEGHKFTLSRIPKGGYIIKYGEWIGRAKTEIPVGDHAHIHNVEDIVDEVRKL